MSRYNVNGLPWSNGIGTDVLDCHSSKEAMTKAGLNFQVEKCELMAQMPFNMFGDNKVSDTVGDFVHKGRIYRPCPNAYGTYRTDLNIPLGLVKSKYEVVQNMDAFTFFDDVIGDDVQYVRAGKFGYGHKIFICAKINTVTEVNGDPIEHYLVFSNSHDGSSSLNIMFTPIRVFCTNCLNSALQNSDSYIRLRHTTSIKERLDIGKRVLEIAFEYSKNSTELYKSLTKVKMSDDEVMKYIANLILSQAEVAELISENDPYCYKKLYNRDYLTMERTKISMRKVNQMVNTLEYYFDGIGQQQIAGTAWGAYNAITGFYSNVANLEGEKRMDSLLYGTANTAMQKALVSAYDMVKVA